MKILHIITSLDIGGAQTVLEQLILGWHETSDEHVVVSLLKSRKVSERFCIGGITIHHLNMKTSRLNIAAFLRLVHLIRTIKPDIVQTWLYHADLIGSAAACIATKAPIIWGLHHTISNSKSVKPSTWRIIKILRMLSKIVPDRILCCSASAYQTHFAIGYPTEKMQVIFNGVDTSQFIPNPFSRQILRQELGLAENTRLIGLFARYHPQKDLRTFLQAAAMLSKLHPEVHFVLAGEGMETSNADLKLVIAASEMQAKLHLLGVRQDMPQLLSAVDLVTLTSSYGEALPMVLCEGMACGTLCVATNVGDVAHLIGDTGMVVEKENPQVLADAWHRVLNFSSPEYLALSQEARQRIISLFSSSRMVGEYKREYQEAASRNEAKNHN